MMRTFREKLGSSMGLKLVATVSVVVFALVVLGTVFMARMLTADQYQQIDIRGRDLGLFLGKAVTDPLVSKDMIKIDGLVTDAVKSQDMLYAYVVDSSGRALNSAFVSFNRENPDLKAFLLQEKTDDTAELAGKVNARFDALTVTSDIMIGSTKLGTVKLGFSRSGVKKKARRLVNLLIGMSIGLVVSLAVIVYVMTGRMIVRPIVEAVTVASSVGAGNVSLSVRVRSVDELGMLGRGMNRMILSLKGMIERVREAAGNLDSLSGNVKNTSMKIAGGSSVQAESVEEAASSVNEMHFALKEIAGNVEDLYKTSEQTSSTVMETAASVDEVAKTMSELAASIEETSTAIAQMSAAIHQTAEHVETLSAAAEGTAASSAEISASVKEVEANASQSVSLAEAVAVDAQQLGMQSIEKTIEGMGRIEANSRRTADVVNRLGERAESIGSILTVIEDITDQTSLLALNAAILAAQAGEHGKGFAVVAAEIRELANRTASSTKEIGKLITSVQDESRDAVQVMQEGIVIVAEGVHLSMEAGEALKKILERATRSRDMSRSINRAAIEQTRGIQQVGEAIDKINEMTHQIAKAANEQKVGSEQITRASDKMREITRFVSRSTADQAKAGKDIAGAVENMSAKIALINRATGEVRAGSDLIVNAIERIKGIAKENTLSASGLNDAVNIMASQAESLKKEMEKFKTEA